MCAVDDIKAALEPHGIMNEFGVKDMLDIIYECVQIQEQNEENSDDENENEDEYNDDDDARFNKLSSQTSAPPKTTTMASI